MVTNKASWPHMIDDLRVSYGVDIRPELQVAHERTKFQEYYNWCSDHRPALFEQMITSATEFRMRATFTFPGRGSVDFDTFTVNRRGPVFIFPLAIAGFDAEVEVIAPDVADRRNVFLECLGTFRRTFPDLSLIHI